MSLISGVRAPHGAAGDGNLKFSGQVIKLRISLQPARDLQSKGRSIDDLIGGKPGKRAAGYVAYHIAAGAAWRQADRIQPLYDFRQIFNGEPMQLDTLPHRNIGQIAAVALRYIGNDPNLFRGGKAVDQRDAHHEVLCRIALAAFAAGSSQAVSLGVNAPPFEVRRGPIGRNGRSPVPRKGAYFIKSFPRVFLALDPFRSLRLGFLDLCHLVLPLK